MMKTKNLWMLIVILLFFGMTAHAQDATKQESKPYLSVRKLPDLLKWLPAPPDTTSEAFVHDIMRYMWGKTQRLDSARAAIAIRDAVWNIDSTLAEFCVPFGLEISREKTPEIYTLLERGIKTCDQIGGRAKWFYHRKRPFMRMNEHMLTRNEEAGLIHNGSYPSGHTIRGWSAALLLSEINPAAADTILARGMMYGDSRVIVGAHWQSDVDAGRLAGSAAVVTLHTCPEFLEQLAKARAEFQRLTATLKEE
ncbi:MAG: phosphatase PAP2 family protein [Prevotella sp.]|nr:phosphatase PAP2 family protein [Prevotella sp.]